MQLADPRDQRIAELERLVAQLIAENRELWARLDMNSSNSSKPPSSDGPGASREKKPTGRSRGGQPGREGNRRSLLPPERVDAFIEARPEHCGRCNRHLRGDDPNPRRRQVIELPPVAPHVTEIRYHALCCPDCGLVTCAPEPPDLPRGAFGPRLLSIIGLLTGKFGVSKRGAREFLSDVLGVDMAVGSISKSEVIFSDALAPAVEEARAYVRAQPSANLDETGWREAAKRAWLWVATTALVAVFTISRSRGSQVAQDLVGQHFQGIVSSDRWSAYTWLPLEQRQICWAHLKRDFKGLSELEGPGAAIGEALLAETECMFEWWARVRDGTVPRNEFQLRLRRLMRRVGELLVAGEVCSDGRVAGICQKIQPGFRSFALSRPYLLKSRSAEVLDNLRGIGFGMSSATPLSPMAPRSCTEVIRCLPRDSCSPRSVRTVEGWLHRPRLRSDQPGEPEPCWHRINRV